MTEPVQSDHGVEFQFGIGQRPDGSFAVSMSVTTCRISTTAIVITPDQAEALAPQLARELISAAKEARREQRKHTGLVIAQGLPDSLRNGQHHND